MDKVNDYCIDSDKSFSMVQNQKLFIGGFSYKMSICCHNNDLCITISLFFVYFQALDAKEPAQRVAKKLLHDQLLVRETLQNIARKIGDTQDLNSVKDKLLQMIYPLVKNVVSAEMCTKIAVEHGMEVAAEFMSQTTSVSLDKKNQDKLEQALKKRDDKQKEYRNSSSRKRFKATERDKSTDVCKICKEIGHWWNDPECPMYKKEKS